MKALTVEEVDKMMKQYFNEPEIRVIKDTIIHGSWGDADMSFPDGKTEFVYAYITNRAHNGGNFTGREVTQLFNRIHRKIYKKGNEIPFMMHERNWWGAGTGSIIAFNFGGNHISKIERQWAEA